MAGIAAALALVASFTVRQLRFLRIIEDTATSRVRSAAQGYVELEGKVEAPDAKVLNSPLRGIPCVWWSYRVEDSSPAEEAEPAPWDVVLGLSRLVAWLLGTRGTGRLVEGGSSHDCFMIRDGTGACIVDPDQSDIVGAQTDVWHKGTQRFEESVIRTGERLYALGLFMTPEDHAAKSEQREVGALISEWQLNRLKLAERFDANRDGQLDPSEWQAIWRTATEQMRASRRGRDPAPEMHVLCKPGDRRPFVLSRLSQRRLANRAWFEAVTGLLVSILLAVTLLSALHARGVL